MKYQYPQAARILVSGKTNLDRGDHAPGWCVGRSVVPVSLVIAVTVVPTVIARDVMIVVVAVIASVPLIHHDLLHAAAVWVESVEIVAIDVIHDHRPISSALPVLPVVIPETLDHDDAAHRRTAIHDDGTVIARVSISHDDAPGDRAVPHHNLG
jgi:hypothetical protein